MTENNKAIGGQTAAKNIYLLSGLIRCGECNEPMTIKNAGSDRKGGYYRVYKCPKCGMAINYHEAEDVILGHIEHVAADPKILETAVEIANNAAEMEAADAMEELRPLYERRDALKKEQQNLMAFARKLGEDAVDVCADDLRRVHADITLIEGDIRRLEKNIRTIDVQVMKDVVSRFINIRKQPKKDQRAQVRELIKTVSVYAERIDVAYATTANGDSSLTPAAIVARLILSIPHITKSRV